MRLRTLLLMLLLFLGAVLSQNVLQDLLGKMASRSNLTSEDAEETARKKKKSVKFVAPLILGALMVKSILLPLAFKAMAVMTGIAVLVSGLSLIVSSIVGFVRLAWKDTGTTSVKVLTRHPHSWAKDDENSTKNLYTLETVDYDPHIPAVAAAGNQYLSRY